MVKKTFWLFLFLFLCPLLVSAERRHHVYFEKTAHELHVYRITGDRPGPTMMIIGGIQGDEPSGYLTADLYTESTLLSGELIVVPRANFFSIIAGTRNGSTGDLNRKFGADNTETNVDSQIAGILKELIHESDVLINLHEGSGYYNPTWVDAEENPSRYGQSIIYDAETYRGPHMAAAIPLGKMTRSVVARVNRNIEKKRYLFRANNHDTLAQQTKHPEQRRSASYYALTEAHIPAFGIEISKSINDLSLKMQLLKLAVNAVMQEFDIVLDVKNAELDKPQLEYLLVQVNQNPPYALRHGTTLGLQIGDRVRVADVIANYDRGLIADVAGVGAENDLDHEFTFQGSTRVVIRKDAEICGWVDLGVASLAPKTATDSTHVSRHVTSVDELQVLSLRVFVDGKPFVLGNGRTLYVPDDGTLVLSSVRTNVALLNGEVKVNFKGFVPPGSVNNGNDTSYPIALNRDLWTKYSVQGEGRKYPIVCTYLDKLVGNAWVVLTSGASR